MRHTNVTAGEAQVLNLIARDEYQPLNGARPSQHADTCAVWTDSVSDSAERIGITRRQFSGICSSLSQKGLITCYRGTHRNQDPSSITLTIAGFDAWLDHDVTTEMAKAFSAGTKCA